jgi:NADH-quinone oxidoreductase subunit E
VDPGKEAGNRPAPQSSKSYVGTPSKPEDGRVVSESATTPMAGTRPADAETRRDGSESKPDVVVTEGNKSSDNKSS